MSLVPPFALSAHIPTPRDHAVSRRGLLKASGAVVGASAFGIATSAPASAGTAAVARRSAASAAALADAFGVNAVTSSSTGVWGKRDLMADRLKELGVSHIRCRLFKDNRGQLEMLRRLASAGIRSNLVLGDPRNQIGTPEELVNLAATQLPGVVSSFEGANEWNLNGGSNWVGELRTHQARAYRAVKGNSRTRGLPVLAPALGRREGFAQLGNITGMCDVGNMHLYPGGWEPSRLIDEQRGMLRAVSGTQPIMITETGWHNAKNSRATHFYTSEEVAGIYAPRLLLEHFLRGTRRVFLYEIVDDHAEPGRNDHEAHFGLLRSDFSRKPAFVALANMMRLLDSGGASSFQTGALEYGVSGAPSDLRQVLVQRRDGSFVLFLWRDVSIWDPQKERNLGCNTVSVQVNLARTARVQNFRPAATSRALSAVARTSSVKVPLSGEVVALEITPG